MQVIHQINRRHRPPPHHPQEDFFVRDILLAHLCQCYQWRHLLRRLSKKAMQVKQSIAWYSWRTNTGKRRGKKRAAAAAKMTHHINKRKYEHDAKEQGNMFITIKSRSLSHLLLLFTFVRLSLQYKLLSLNQSLFHIWQVSVWLMCFSVMHLTNFRVRWVSSFHCF